MLKSSNRFLYLIIASLLSLNLFGQALDATAVELGDEHHDLKQEEQLKDEIKEDIQHHIQDSHYFDILSDGETETHYGFPLPVILWDNGVKFFMASAFDHGKKLVDIDGQYYKLYHSKIYKTDANGTLTLDKDGYPTNEKPLDFSITKSVLMVIVASLLLFILFRALSSGYKKSPIPKGVGRFLEPLVVYVRDEIAIPNIGKKNYRKYMGFILTVFFFIWILNMFGLMPFGVNVTGNITVTFTLALITFLITTFTGNKTYWRHIFDPLGNTMPWIAKIPIYIILIPIEVLGLFIKPFSLMIRLYANMFAGHIVMLSLIGLIFLYRNFVGGSMSLLLAIIISFIEFFAAALQAYIFAVLSAVYFGMASEEHHEEH